MSGWQLCLCTLPACPARARFRSQMRGIPPPSLSSHQRADFPAPLLNGLILTGTTASCPWVLSIQGTRCAKTEEGTFPHVPRCVLRIRAQGPAWHPWAEPPTCPPTHPGERACSVPWPFPFGENSTTLCNFCPCCGLPASLKLNFSVTCRPAKDSVSNKHTQFYTSPPAKIVLGSFHPLLNTRKKWLENG